MFLQRFAEEGAEVEVTQEQEVKVTQEQEVKTYTQEQVDELIRQQKEESDKLFNDKWDKKYAKYKEEEKKAVDEAKRLAEMSATERAEHERDELQRQLDEYKAQATLVEMKNEARKILTEQSVPITEDILNVLCTIDADKTKTAINSYAEMFNTAVTKAVQDALKGNAPKVSTGSVGLTKEQILKVQDRNERQRLINENFELFK